MSAGYLIKEGIAGIKRTKLAAFTSMFSLFVAVLLIGVLSRIGFNAYEVAQILKQQVEVEVFLENIDEQSTIELRERIQDKPVVAYLAYISRDSASVIFREEFGMGGEALADLNFLPASFKIMISEQATVNEIEVFVSEIETYTGVEDVRFNLALLQLMETRTEQLAIAGGVLGIFILFVALILVFNTIRLTIYAKRDLIRAMKLVGATNSFIRRPFLIEGVLQGAIAGIAAAGLLYLIFDWVIPYYISQVGILGWPFGRWYYLIGAVVFVAILMGWMGSKWAARKFISETTVYG